MEKMNAEYIEQHLEAVNDYDSFGRSLCAAILNESLKLVKGKSEEIVRLTADISISPTKKGCMITIKIGAEEICKQVLLL